MKLVSIVDSAGSGTWVNSDAVAYISGHGRDECVIHFIGASENRLQCKETLGEVAKKIRGPLSPQG